MRRLPRVALGLVALSTALVLAEGCLGRVDRDYIDELLDASGGGDDATTDGPALKPVDDASGGGDASSSDDGGQDAAPDDARADGPADSGRDVVDTGAPDGCGPTNTAANCGACGATCNTTTSSTTPACNGTTCLYSCLPNRYNCNVAPPDTNGCECVGTGCCGASCQTAHSNGVGQTYYDCQPLSTYNQTQAMAACVAFTKDPSKCAVYGCTGNAGSVVCTPEAAPLCTCWKYEPGNTGVNGKVSTTCTCPISASATSWN